MMFLILIPTVVKFNCLKKMNSKKAALPPLCGKLLLIIFVGIVYCL